MKISAEEPVTFHTSHTDPYFLTHVHICSLPLYITLCNISYIKFKGSSIFLEQSLSPELEKVIENKEIYTSKDNNEIALPITQNDNKERRYNSQVIYPIISDGDVIGSVILLSKEQNTKMGDTELKVVQSAAGFLSSQMDV